jgi:hypothetical protein
MFCIVFRSEKVRHNKSRRVTSVSIKYDSATGPIFDQENIMKSRSLSIITFYAGDHLAQITDLDQKKY